jgi:transposase InsO family protein
MVLTTGTAWICQRPSLTTVGWLGGEWSSIVDFRWQFRTTLKQPRMRASMGRVGSCYDNAVAESFFASLKAEIGTRVWATRAQARRAVFAYIAYYNRNRLHSTLKRQTHTRPASATVPDALAA